MQGWIVDASVAVKWLADENESHVKEALDLLHGAHERRYALVAPDFLLIEVANALVRGKRLVGKSLERAVSLFISLPIEYEPSTPERIARASVLASTYALTVYDSLYVSLGLEKNMPLVTANAKHQGAVKGATVFDIKHWNVANEGV